MPGRSYFVKALLDRDLQTHDGSRDDRVDGVARLAGPWCRTGYGPSGGRITTSKRRPYGGPSRRSADEQTRLLVPVGSWSPGSSDMRHNGKKN